MSAHSYEIDEKEELTFPEISETSTVESVEIKPLFIDNYFNKISKDKNFAVSTLSVEILLAMIYQGASGETAEKLASVLDVENQHIAADKYKCILERLNGISKATTLDIANKIFIMKGFPLKCAFENAIAESFMSKIDPIDFEDNKKASDDINQWAEDETKNKITNLISSDSLDESARLALVNTLYFKSIWDTPFNEQDTTMQPFFISEDEAVDCEMMFISDCFNYSEDEPKLDAKLLELLIKGKEVSMIFILPDEYNGIDELEKDLAKVNLSNLMLTQAVKNVEVFLPKFKIEATTNVKSVLETMGLETIFERNAADFSEISESCESLCVSQFIQKAFVEIDEKGEETAVNSEGTDRSKPSEFIADHPFIFLFRANGESGNTVLFVGKVLKPM